MNCCLDCFIDTEIRAIISGLSNTKGRCDICEATHLGIVDIEDLSDYFSPILDLYERDDSSTISIHQKLASDWNIFANENCSKKILQAMFSDSSYNDLLTHSIKPNYIDNTESIEIWNEFTEEIKAKNRFFITNNLFVRDVVEKLLKYHTFVLRSGKKLYRGRISDSSSGLPVAELGAPPSTKARSGRANPQGISYLYLADTEETTLYEVRASFLDYVSIGEFELNEDVKIVALRDVNSISPFLPDLDLKEYASNKNILFQFGSALSKPLRRIDSDLEYLPTQYLCEYIKSLGIDGVEYTSAMHSGGINYAFFDESKFKPVRVFTKEVKKILIET